MEVTVALIITALTLVAGEITKLTSIPNKYIPLQNIIIAIVASIVCIAFSVENMTVASKVHKNNAVKNFALTNNNGE